MLLAWTGFCLGLLLSACVSLPDHATPAGTVLSPAPRLAVVALAKDDATRAVADLLFAEFAKQPDVTLVERAALAAILHEQELAALQRPERRVALGQQVGADFLVLVDKMEAQVQIRLTDVPSGIVLHQEALSVNALAAGGNAEKLLPSAVGMLLRGLPVAGSRPLTTGAVPVAILPMRCLNPEDGGNWAGPVLAKLLSLQLGHTPGVVTLEREDLQRLQAEAALYAEPVNAFVTAAALIQGTFEAKRTADGWTFTVHPLLRRRDGLDRSLAAASGTDTEFSALGKTLARTVLTALPGPARIGATPKPFDLVAEKAFYHHYGTELMSAGEFDRAAGMFDTALALTPGDAATRRLLICALQRRTPNSTTQPAPRPMREYWDRLEAVGRAMELTAGLPQVVGEYQLDLLQINRYLTGSTQGLSAEQMARLRELRSAWRRYQEEQGGLQDGVLKAPNFLRSVPAFFEQPEAAVAYAEPIVTHYLDSPAISRQDKDAFLQALSSIVPDMWNCQHWDRTRAALLVNAMFARVKVASATTPLEKALTPLPDLLIGKYEPATPELVVASREVLAICNQLAKQDAAWLDHLQPAGCEAKLWQALGYLPVEEQPAIFQKLFLPGLQPPYREKFILACLEFFWNHCIGLPRWQATTDPTATTVASAPVAGMLKQAVEALNVQEGRQIAAVLASLKIHANFGHVTLATAPPVPLPAWLQRVDLDAVHALPWDATYLALNGGAVEGDRVWLQLSGMWNGMVEVDVRTGACTGVPAEPTQHPRGGSDAYGGGRGVAVTSDALYVNANHDSWPKGILRIPRTAFTPSVAAEADPKPSRTVTQVQEVNCQALTVLPPFLYWANGSAIHRRNLDLADSAPECLGNARNEQGAGPLDGGLTYDVVALAVDPPRQRVLAILAERNPQHNRDPGPREGVWAYYPAKKHWTLLCAMSVMVDSKRSSCEILGTRLLLAANPWQDILFDAATERPEVLRNEHEFAWRPGSNGPWRQGGNGPWQQGPVITIGAFGLAPGPSRETAFKTVPLPQAPADLLLYDTAAADPPLRLYHDRKLRQVLPSCPELKRARIIRVFAVPSGFLIAYYPLATPFRLQLLIWRPEHALGQ